MKHLISSILFLIATIISFAQERYFEVPKSYEDKSTATFKVLRVLNDSSALTRENSYGKFVLLIGKDFYDEQIVSIENPIHIGIYKYETKTLPIVCTSEYALSKYKENFLTSISKNNEQKTTEIRTGNSWSLAGRSIVGSMVSPQHSVREEGTVVVNIIVDKDGNVVTAEIGRGTNIDDKELLSAAVNTAKNTKFSPLKSGTNNQSGKITYRFDLK